MVLYTHAINNQQEIAASSSSFFFLLIPSLFNKILGYGLLLLMGGNIQANQQKSI